MHTNVSIIVPVYNAQNTIRRCAASLVNQTLQDIEILFVDDCSTDQTMELLEQIKEQFPKQVRILQTEHNSGPGGARNAGLCAARGEYVGFVDSDDFVDVSMYEKLYLAADHRMDVVDCGFFDESCGGSVFSVDPKHTGKLDDEKRCWLISREGYIWCKLFRRAFLEQNYLRFREQVMMEDTDFIMCVWALAETAFVVPEVLYQHTDNPDSVTHATKQYQTYTQSLAAMEAIHQRLSALPQYQSVREGVKAMLTGLYLGAIVNIATSQLADDQKVECLTSLRDIRSQVMDSGYQNGYQIEGIGDDCIQLMQLNDRDPKAVVQLLASVSMK